MIQLKDIQFHYPQSEFRLSVEELTFKEQSKTAVIGPSGFGKTTMLNLIAGILLPEEGTVMVDEIKVNKLNDGDRRNFRIQNIGFVFQDFRLVSYLNVLDNILLPFRINTAIKSSPESVLKAKKLADELNISRLIKKYPAKLSHGERQRVAIARALVNNSKVILADEPTGNLDPANKQHIKNILFDTVKRHQATLITVTHDYEMLEGFDEVIDFKDLKKETGS
jgi:putative ABC transport system ATP-binding protein